MDKSTKKNSYVDHTKIEAKELRGTTFAIANLEKR